MNLLLKNAKNKRNNAKILFLYLFFFLLIYNEPIQIGGLSLSVLWKIPVLVYIAIYIMMRKIRKPTFNKFAYGYGIVKLLNGGIFNTTFIAISDFSRFITFPLLFDFVACKLKSSQIACKILFHISQFTILSFIPFILKLLHSKKSLDLADSALEMQEIAGRTSGIFSSPHAASCLLALSIVFLLHYYFSNYHTFQKKLFLVALILLGVYAIILTYARGGWLMLLIGVFGLLAKSNFKYVLTSILLFFSMLLVGSYLMEHNEYFYNRITDRNEKGVKNSPDRIGSGRLWFASNGINFYLDSETVQEYLTGKGIISLMEYQQKKTGLYIYCHNGYIDALAQNGILGFIFNIGMSISMLLYVCIKKGYAHKRFCIVGVLMYIIFQGVQGGAAPYTDFFWAVTLQLATLSQKESQNYRGIIKNKMVIA